MPFAIACPCGKRMRVRDELAGTRVKCPACGRVLLTPKPAPAAPPPLPAKPAPAPRPAPPPARKPPPEDEPVEVVEVAAVAEPEEEAPSRTAETGGDDRVRYWLKPEGGGDSVVILTPDEIWTASPDARGVKRVRRGLEAGESVYNVLDDDATKIPYDRLAKVWCNLHLNDISLSVRTGKLEKEDVTVSLADPETRDEVLDELRDRLGPDWQRTKKQYGVFRAALPGLGFTAFCIFLTFVLYMMLTSTQTGSAGGVKRIPVIGWVILKITEFVGPTGTLVIGGLFVLGGIALTVLGMVKPPLVVTLTPRPAGRRRRARRDDDED